MHNRTPLDRSTIRDRGQATIALVGVLAVTVVLGLALVAIAEAMVHRSRARNAADAAALAASTDPGVANELGEWYRSRGVAVEIGDGHAVASSGPSQAYAWASRDQGARNAAPVLVAVVARAQQLVGVGFGTIRLDGMRVEVAHADAALLHSVANELGLCPVAVPAPAPGWQAFEMC